MRKFLKIIIGIVMIGSLAVGCLPLVRLGGLDFSVLDLVLSATGKTVEGNYDHLGTMLATQMTQLAQEYLAPYLMKVGAIAGLILLAAILTMILSWKTAYYISLVSTIVVGGCSVFIFSQVKPKLEVIEDALDFFGLDEVMEIERLTLILWWLVWLLVLVLSIYGVIISRKDRKVQADVISEIPPVPPVVSNASVFSESVEHSGHRRKFQKKMDRNVYLEQKYNQNAEYEANSTENAGIVGFQGAIVSRNQFYGKKAYPLQERTEIFFAEENGTVFLTKTYGSDTLAGVYFIREYQEYCIDVMQGKTVYLISGQPLGTGRRYYLPRGMEIYLKNQNFIFELA